MGETMFMTGSSVVSSPGTSPGNVRTVSKAPVSAMQRGVHRVLSFCIEGDTADHDRRTRMDSSGRLLVVDDDAAVRAMLVEYLSGHRYEVRAAHDGATMRAEIERDLPDLILLDLRMPGEDGLTLARFLRERYDVGIIMVTASSDVVDRVVGLEIGADDYVAKPFDPRELLARVKSVLRRMQSREAPQSTASVGKERVPVGRCFLDVASHQLVDVAGQEVPMTSMEYDLLKVFIEHPHKVLSRDQILNLTPNRDWE